MARFNDLPVELIVQIMHNTSRVEDLRDLTLSCARMYYIYKGDTRVVKTVLDNEMNRDCQPVVFLAQEFERLRLLPEKKLAEEAPDADQNKDKSQAEESDDDYKDMSSGSYFTHYDYPPWEYLNYHWEYLDSDEDGDENSDEDSDEDSDDDNDDDGDEDSDEDGDENSDEDNDEDNHDYWNKVKKDLEKGGHPDECVCARCQNGQKAIELAIEFDKGPNDFFASRLASLPLSRVCDLVAFYQRAVRHCFFEKGTSEIRCRKALSRHSSSDIARALTDSLRPILDASGRFVCYCFHRPDETTESEVRFLTSCLLNHMAGELMLQMAYRLAWFLPGFTMWRGVDAVLRVYFRGYGTMYLKLYE